MKKGDKGNKVKNLQRKLNKIMSVALVVDGHFGQDTHLIVLRFQEQNNLTQDGIVGRVTMSAINNQYLQIMESSNLMTFGKNRFVVFVDAGHGGIDDSGRYTTSGKRAYHDGVELHDNGNYYEGFENRIVAEQFIQELTSEGIQSVRVYHPYVDTSLSVRTRLVNDYLNRGYYGFLLSFHSNAISSSNSPEKLENTTGFCVYTTKGDTLSDKIAEIHFKNVFDNFTDWNLRTQQRDDSDSDFEANFQVLRQTDTEQNSGRFGAILEEFGFHTSKKDTEFIIANRDKRVHCAVLTAKKVREMMKKTQI
jgi:N-acetylmuramoyl-L-alanine amidase